MTDKLVVQQIPPLSIEERQLLLSQEAGLGTFMTIRKMTRAEVEKEFPEALERESK